MCTSLRVGFVLAKNQHFPAGNDETEKGKKRTRREERNGLRKTNTE
jgi:hypothetical protein